MALLRVTTIRDARAAANIVSSCGVGTAYDLGGVESTQKLYGGLHVTGVCSTEQSFQAFIESATSSGFASPTTRMTFTAVSVRDGEIPTPTTGSSEDVFWRQSWIQTTSADAGTNFLGWLSIR